VPFNLGIISLSFEMKGSGSFKAVCNGDPTSLELFHLPQMKTFNGKLVVIVQATKKSGTIKLHIKGKGIKSNEVALVTI